MLEFIVLGQVPGTHFQIDFISVLLTAVALLGLLLLIVLVLHTWHHVILATRKLLLIEQLTI